MLRALHRSSNRARPKWQYCSYLTPLGLFSINTASRKRISTTTNIGTIGGVRLRPYQEACLQSCLDALQAGSTRIGVSLPTGSGKTTVFISLIGRLKNPPGSQDANRALIIVNSVELAFQTVQQLQRSFPKLSVEIEQGGKHSASGAADVTVATYQTLIRGSRISKFDTSRLKAVIVDEAHHAAAPSYRRILSHFDKNIRSPDVDFRRPDLPHPIPIVGFSATFSRHDGLALGSVFERIVYHRDFLEMIKEQWLCNVKFTAVKAELNLRDVTINTANGEFNPTSLAHVMNTETVNRLVVQSWLDRASSRRSTLVFCVNLDHLRDLTATFRQAGIDARYVYAATPPAERRSLIDAFRNGEFSVLLNVAVLTEGADIPNIDCVIVAKPTRSRNMYAQMIGRGMRLSPKSGKLDCHIMDFVDSTSRIPGIVTVPSLFGLDPDETIVEESVEELEVRAAANLEVEEATVPGDGDSGLSEPKSVTYIDYENPFALVEDTSGAPHIAKLSSFAWVGCGGDVYVLECLSKGFIRIEPEEDEAGNTYFRARYSEAAQEWEKISLFRKSHYNRPRKILTAENLPDAVRGCDTYAKSKVCHGPMSKGLLRSAKWRKEPATEKQKDILVKRLNARLPEGRDLETRASFSPDSLKRGQAADLITRLKHGANRRFATKIKREVKVSRLQAKERQRRAREDVAVGPLASGEQLQPSIS